MTTSIGKRVRAIGISLAIIFMTNYAISQALDSRTKAQESKEVSASRVEQGGVEIPKPPRP